MANFTRQQSVLVSVPVVMEKLGVTHDSIFEAVDSGDLRWVWNVSLKPKGRRELRFWVAELMRLENRSLPVEAVLDMVVGYKQETKITRRSCGRVLQLQRNQIQRLVEAGELVPPDIFDNKHITRASLVDFLSRRLLN